MTNPPRLPSTSGLRLDVNNVSLAFGYDSTKADIDKAIERMVSVRSLDEMIRFSLNFKGDIDLDELRRLVRENLEGDHDYSDKEVKLICVTTKVVVALRYLKCGIIFGFTLKLAKKILNTYKDEDLVEYSGNKISVRTANTILGATDNAKLENYTDFYLALLNAVIINRTIKVTAPPAKPGEPWRWGDE